MILDARSTTYYCMNTLSRLATFLQHHLISAQQHLLDTNYSKRCQKKCWNAGFCSTKNLVCHHSFCALFAKAIQPQQALPGAQIHPLSCLSRTWHSDYGQIGENWGKRNLVFGLLHLACCNPSPNALIALGWRIREWLGSRTAQSPDPLASGIFFAQATLLLSKHSHMMWNMGNARECLQLNKNRTARRQTSPEGPISQIFAFQETGIMTQKTNTIQDKNKQIDTQQLDWWPVEVRKP